MEAVHGSHDSPVQASDGDGGGPKIAAGIETNLWSQRVHPKVPGIVVSPT